MPDDDNAPSHSRDRFRRRVIWSLLVLVPAVALLVLLLPTLISTGTGTSWVVGVLNDRIAGRVTIDNLSVGWFSGQKITGIALDDPDGKTVAVLDQIDAPDMSLWSLLRGNLNLGTVHIVNSNTQLIEDEMGTTHLERALASPPKTSRPSKPKDAPSETSSGSTLSKLKLELTVEGGQAVYQPWEQDQVELTDFTLELKVPSLQQFVASIAGSIGQGENDGLIEAEATITNLVDASGKLNYDTATVDADVDLKNVPTIALQGVIAKFNDWKPAIDLPGMLGPTTDLSIHTKGLLSSANAQITLNAKYLKSAAMVANQKTGLTGEMKLHLHVDQENWKSISTSHKTLAGSELLKPFDLKVMLNRVEIPRGSNGLDTARTAVAANITSSEIQLDTGKPKIGRITLRNAVVGIESDGLGKAATANVDLVAEQGPHSGRFSVDLAVTDLLSNEGKVNNSSFVELVAQATDFPLVVPDELLGLNGLLLRSIGQVVEAQLTGSLKPAGDAGGAVGTFAISFDAEHLQLHVEADKSAAGWTLKHFRPTTFVCHPELFEIIKKSRPALADALGNLTLARPARAELKIAHLVLPTSEPFDLWAAELGYQLRLTDIVPIGDDRFEGIVLNDLTIEMPNSRIGTAMRMPLTATATVHGHDCTLDAAVIVEDLINRNPVSEDGTVRLFQHRPLCKINAALSGLPINLIERSEGPLKIVAGERFDRITFNAANDLDDRSTITFALEAKTDRLDVAVEGNFVPGQSLSFGQESRARLVLPPEAQTVLLGGSRDDEDQSPPPLEAIEPLELNLRLQKAQFAFNETDGGLDRSKSSLSLEVDALQAAFRTPNKPHGVELRALHLELAGDDLGGPVTIKAASEHTIIDHKTNQRFSGRLFADVRLADLFNPAKVSWLKTRMEPVPVALIDALSRQEGLLVLLLGPTLSSLDLQITPDPAGKDLTTLAMAIDSPGLTADLSCRYVAGRLVEFDRDSKASLRLEPETFDKLLRHQQPKTKPAIKLEKAATFNVEFRRLSIGLPQPAASEESANRPTYDPKSTALAARLRCPNAKILFQRPNGPHSVQFTSLVVDIDASNLLKPLTLSASGQLITRKTAGGSTEPGRLESRTTIAGLFDKTGDPPVIKTNILLEGLPVEPIDALAGADGEFLGYLGNQIKTLRIVGPIDLTGQPSDVDLEIDAPYLTTKISARVGEELTLRQDIKAIVHYTPHLAKIAKFGNVILIDAVATKEPVVITIPAKGFRVPLRALMEDHADLPKKERRIARNQALKQINANIEVEPGTVILKNSWVLGGLRLAMRALGYAEDTGDREEAVFTPLKVSIKNGVIRSNDLWMSTNYAVVGAISRVNLRKRRMNVTVGISGQTFAKFGDGDKIIRPHEVFEIPVKAPLNKRPEPDWGKLLGNLGARGLAKLDDTGLATLGVDLLTRANRKDKKKHQWPNHPKNIPVRQKETSDQKPQEDTKLSDEKQKKPKPDQKKENRDTTEELIDLGFDLLKEALEKDKNKK